MSKLKVKLWYIELPEDKKFSNVLGEANERGYTVFEHTEEVEGNWGMRSVETEYYFLNKVDALMVANNLAVPDKCVKWKHAFFKAKIEFA
jgi:hypothetical protein